MFSLLLTSTIVVSWGVMNINIPAMAQVFDDVPLAMVENLATVSSLFIMIAVLLSHQIAKLFGYKRTIIAGLSLVALSGLTPLVFDNFYLIFISRASLGFGIGMFQALLVSMNKYFYQGNQRTRMFGYQGAFEGLGGVCLTFIAGQLVRLSWQGIFYIYLLVIPVILMFWLFVPKVTQGDIDKQNQTQVDESTQAKIDHRTGNSKSYLVPGYLLLVFSLAVMYMILGIKATSLILEKGIGSASDGATVLLMVGVGAMSSGFAFAKVTSWTKELTLTAGYFFLALAMFLTSVAGNVALMALGGMMAGFSFRTIVTYLLNHINSGAFKNSGLITSLLLVALNLGTFGSPYGAIFLGSVAQSQSGSALFMTSALILTVMTVLSFLFWLFKKKQAPVCNEVQVEG